MGVPVITMQGNRHAARVGASIMHQVGLEELVAHSEDAYIALALALARDRQRLEALRAGLRRQMQESPLMDEQLFAATIENAYRQMWRKWCAEDSCASTCYEHRDGLPGKCVGRRLDVELEQSNAGPGPVIT